MKILFNFLMAKYILDNSLSTSFAIVFGVTPFIGLFSRVFIPKFQKFSAESIELTVYDYIIPVCLNLVIVLVITLSTSANYSMAIFYMIFIATNGDFFMEFNMHLKTYLIQKSFLYSICLIPLFMNAQERYVSLICVALSLHSVISSFRNTSNILDEFHFISTDFIQIINEFIKSIPSFFLSSFSLNIGASADFIIITRARGALNILSSVEITKINQNFEMYLSNLKLKKLVYLTSASVLIIYIISWYFSYRNSLILLVLDPILVTFAYYMFSKYNRIGTLKITNSVISFFAIIISIIACIWTDNYLGIYVFFFLYSLVEIILYKNRINQI
jgi:hypothetical protein